MVNGQSSITRGAAWKHAHCKKVHVFSDSVLLHKPRCVGSNECFNVLGTEGRSSHEKQPLHQLTLNGTCVLVIQRCKYCTSCKNSCWRPGTHLSFFQTGSSSRACSTTSPTGKARKRKTNVQLKRMKYLVIGVSVVQDRKWHEHRMKE